MNSLLVRLTALVLYGCGASSAGLEDAGAEAGPRRVILGPGGAVADPLELAQADAGAELALEDAALDAEQLEDAALDAGELAQADAAEAGALVDAGPCDGAPSNGCGGCEALAKPPGTSCAGELVGNCGICNWAVQCVYECTAPATTIRVCPNGLESCDGRP